jgi:hypothetical protein
MPHVPDNPNVAQIWLDGEAPNQQLSLYVPRGDKGDPGGITLGTSLGTTDLNTITTAGVYRQGSSVPVNANYPTTDLGVLVVHQPSANPWVIQEYQPQATVSPRQGQVFYRRTYTNTSGWTAWRSYSATRVDQTAGRVIYQWDDLNNRDQLIYGDTGRRLITPAGFTAGTVTVRRSGSTVALYVVGGTMTASGDYVFPDAIPVGFRPHANSYYLYRQNVTMTTRSISITSAGIITIVGYDNTANMSAVCVWDTTDNWPATLPGTASGSIPNL